MYTIYMYINRCKTEIKFSLQTYKLTIILFVFGDLLLFTKFSSSL